MIDLILATPDVDELAGLAASAPECGIRVVRRCIDAVDLLAAGAIDPGLGVVLSAGLPRLSADVMARLGPERTVVGIARDPLDATVLDGLGLRHVLVWDPDAPTTWRAVRNVLVPARESASASGVWSTGAWDAVADPSRLGRLVAVWGPIGSPGRTTVALGVSEAIAAGGSRVCLVDADTYAPSVAMDLGLLEDGGGLLRASRQADSGLLDEANVVAATRCISGSWHVLAGVPDSDHWSELSPSSMDRLWESVRGAFDVVVVDVGFCLETDDAPAAWSRRRNTAAVSAVATADQVVAVGDGSARGAARLITAWPALARLGAAKSTIVRNRSRRGSTWQWDDALRAHGLDAEIRGLPSDDRALAYCWARGRSLGEGARRSPLRKSLQALASDLMSG